MTDRTETSQAARNDADNPVIRRWQIGLVIVGVLGLILGGLVLLHDVAPKNYVGIGIWFLGALILHDGIVATAVVAVQIGLRKAGRRVPFAVLGILQGAIVVGAIMSLIVFPEIYKSAIGTNNPTVLPLDYSRNLIGFYIALVIITAIAIGGYLFARRQNTRSSSAQA